MTDRFESTLVIAAAVIAAITLAREDMGRPSSRLKTVIAESVRLARAIPDKVVR